MSSPSVVGTPTETAISTAGTSHVVNLPAGAVGNLLIAICDKGSVAATVNALTGWTELLDENLANGLYIAYRVCDGSEGATTTFTLSASTRGAWIVYEITGYVSPGTQAPQIGTTSSGSSTAPDPPSVSATGGAKDILTIACFGRAGEGADDDTWVTAAPSGFTGLLQKACGTVGTNLGGMVATATLQSHTATSDPGAFTCATGAWRAQTIVVHPPPSRGQVAWAELEVPIASSTPKAGTEAGSGGTQASTLRAALPRTEVGSGGVQASSLHAAYSLTDTGAGVETSFLRQQKAASDSGIGADASTVRAAYVRTDSGAAAGSSLLVARYARADAGTGADSSSVTQGDVSKVGTDTGISADSSTLRASLSRSEAGTCSDLAALHASLLRADAGTYTEVSRLAFRPGDTGTGGDVSFLHALLVASDAVAVFDIAQTLSLLPALLDIGSGADSALVFTGGFIPARVTASVTTTHLSSAVGLNRGGEGSTIEGDKEKAEVERWP